MGNNEDVTPVKAEKAQPNVQSLDQPAIHPYPEWATFQGYYGPRMMPPPYFGPTVAPGHVHPYMWGPQGRRIRVFFVQCKEPVHQAYKLGLAAAVLVAVSHAISNVLGGCTCICSRDALHRSSLSKQMAAAALFLSWIVVIAAFTVLMIGAMSHNSKSRASCGIAYRRFLSIGGILCFVHGLFCLVYFVSTYANRQEERKA